MMSAMINTGDKFTAKDLRTSVQEVCDYNIQKYVNIGRSSDGVVIGGSMLIPCKINADNYADICIKEYSDIPSSALYLDKQLREKGFKTAYRFAHKYNTGELSVQEIVRDAYRLDWFYQLACTAEPFDKYKDKYWTELEDAFRISYYYAQYLWAMNPRVSRDIARALRMPYVENWPQITSAILGMGFQFHPYDVYEHAIEHISPDITKKQYKSRYAEQEAFKNTMKDNYDIDTGCLVLSPKNRDKLHKIVTRTDTPYWIQVIKSVLVERRR